MNGVFSDLRYTRNLLSGADHYIWDVSDTNVTPYSKACRQVCFTNPSRDESMFPKGCSVKPSPTGVYTAKKAPSIKSSKVVPLFDFQHEDFFYPSKEEAVQNRHLFDVCGFNVFRIVGEERSLMWTDYGQEFLIDYGALSQRSFSSVLCHRSKDLTVAVGQDRRLYMLNHETGQLMVKSEKMHNTLFASPLISWTWDSCPSLITFSVGRRVTIYDFLVEKKFVDLKTRSDAKVCRVTACPAPSSSIVAVHYDNMVVDIFDVRKPELAVNTIDSATVSCDWQPSSQKLSLLNENGQVQNFLFQSRMLEPLAGLPVDKDTTGVFWLDNDELVLTSSRENGCDGVDYYKRNAELRFAHESQWSTEEDLLCVRVDCGNRSIYAALSNYTLYGLNLPEKKKETKQTWVPFGNEMFSRLR